MKGQSDPRLIFNGKDQDPTLVVYLFTTQEGPTLRQGARVERPGRRIVRADAGNHKRAVRGTRIRPGRWLTTMTMLHCTGNDCPPTHCASRGRFGGKLLQRPLEGRRCKSVPRSVQLRVARDQACQGCEPTWMAGRESRNTITIVSVLWIINAYAHLAERNIVWVIPPTLSAPTQPLEGRPPRRSIGSVLLLCSRHKPKSVTRADEGHLHCHLWCWSFYSLAK